MAAWFNKEDQKLSSVKRYIASQTNSLSSVYNSLSALRVENPETYRKLLGTTEYSAFQASVKGLADIVEKGND